MKIRNDLKRLSMATHRQTEVLHWSEQGFDGLAGYRHFLSCLNRAHRQLGLPAAVVRERQDMIAHERRLIGQLALDLGSAGQTPMPACTLDRHQAWGIGYALIGSGIGAAFILNSGRLQESWPCHYLHASRDFAKSGGVRRFFDELNACELDIGRALDGVREVFRIIGDVTVTPKDPA